MKILKLFLPIAVSISSLFATWFDDIPRTVTQPNGDLLSCYISGDQYGRRLHDEKDFTIILDEEDGFYYYAIEGINGQLIPSDLIPGITDPELFGLEPGLAIIQEEYDRNKEFYHNSVSERDSRDAPTSGEIAQINVFIRFADDPAFPNPRSYYDAVFQTDEDEPSLRNYYWEVSYNSLLVNTFHFPGSINDVNTAYQDEHPRAYYQPQSGSNPEGYQNDNERTQREHTLLANALNAIASEVSPLMDIDANDDGYVDAVSFVIYGQPGDWADLLWPHRWSLYTQNVTINGAQVWDYLFMLSESWYFNVGVLCHEFFHVLGAPDLYHYDGGGAPSPVGGWDVMEANTNPPQYPSAFMKYKYGDWLPDLPEITESGVYTLNPLQQQENAIYKIASPNSETEYFVVEYRRKDGLYDSNTPGNRNGLVVYRINTSAGNGNAGGPPDEVYCYRPGGTLQNNGNFDNAPYSSDYNHTQLNDNTNPSCFLYNNGAGGEGGMNLYAVTEAEQTISFTVSFGQPVIDVDPDELNFTLDAGDFGNQTLTLSNVGEPETILNYQVGVTGVIPFQNPQGGPDEGNYYWSTSTEEPGMDYEWINIDGLAIQLSLPHNDQFASSPIELPFDFDFFGETYNYVEVNANGWVGWTDENEIEWLNVEIPTAGAPRPAIFGFWDDLNPNNDNGNSNSSGDIYYHTSLDRVVIWYNDVVRWNTTDWGQFDFQIVLYADGTFRTNYREMAGVLTSGTIGWQNGDGSAGTQIVANGEFVSNSLSWSAASSDEDVSWIFLSSSTGDLSGALIGTETAEIYVQVVTTGLDPGYHEATISITSPETDPASVPVHLIVTGESSTPTLPYIDITGSETGIVDLPDNVDPLFSAVASRYTHIEAPNGDLIQFLIQDAFTDDQILHARRVLASYLTDIPDSEWGNDKSNVANAMAASNAILFLLNNEDEYENPDLWVLIDSGVNGQDLLATEVFPEGSAAYMNSTDRDATYEEVLHYMHGFGIQIALPALQVALESAMESAIENNIYNPLSDLPEDDYDEEYLAMGLECYFGIWAHDPNEDGFSGDQEYAFIDRLDMANGDPQLFEIINGFFGETWEYNAVLPVENTADFSIKRQNNLDYTHRSRYLKDVILRGENPTNITGNDFVNIFTGNEGDNHFMGFRGDDIFHGGAGLDRAIYQGNFNEYILIPPYATDDSSYQVLDIILVRDGIDHLFDVEEVEFNGEVYLLTDILSKDESGNLPNKFALHAPYPNPFNPTTTIHYDIAQESEILVSVYDMMGRTIKTLQNGKMDRGRYAMDWSATDALGQKISSGIYFIKLTSESYQKTVKVLYLK